MKFSSSSKLDKFGQRIVIETHRIVADQCWLAITKFVDYRSGSTVGPRGCHAVLIWRTEAEKLKRIPKTTEWELKRGRT